MLTWLEHSLAEIRDYLPQKQVTDPLFYACAFIIGACVMLGGVSRDGFISDTILAFLAIPLLGWGIWRLFDIQLSRQMRGALWFCSAVVAIPLLQLLPLPAWLWTLLPYREISAESFTLARHSVPWMPISVSPEATWIGLISLLPPLSIFIAVMLLGYHERRWLSLVILVVGVIGAFLGILQVAQGPTSALRFYQFTNRMEAVGFFANRNHFAALVNVLILLTAAWAVEAGGSAGSAIERKQFHAASTIGSVGCFALFVLLLAAQAMARSRAGIALTMVALLAALALAFVERRETSKGSSLTSRLVLGAAVVAGLLIVQLTLFRILERFEVDPFEDERRGFVVTTIKAAAAYMPVGSGVGTFVPVYQLFEPPKDFHPNTHLNRAHNEFAESLLETGIFGVVLMGYFLWWFGRRAIEVWRVNAPQQAEAIDWSLVRSATVIIPIVGAHAFFDYPLRTAAMMSIVAYACALLIDPPVSALVRRRRSAPQLRQARITNAAPGLIPALTVSPLPGKEMHSPKALPPPAPGERWGADMQWPDEWRNSSATPDDKAGPRNPK